MTQFKTGVLCILFLFSLSANGQPGIYSEDDMSLQTLFMEAQTAKYQEKYEDQIELLKQLIEKDRSCEACQYEMAIAYFNLEDLEKAGSSIKKALAKDPDNVGYNQAAKSIYEESLNHNEVIKVLNKLIQLDPSDHVAREELVVTAIKAGKEDLALNAISELDARFGVYERSTMWKLEIFKKKKDKKAQIEAVNKLIAQDPDNTRYLNNLASMYLDFGDKKMAQSTWNRILEIDPDDPNANYAILTNDVSANSEVNFLRAIIPMIENKSIPLDDKIRELIPHVGDMSEKADDENNVQLLKLSDKLVRMYPEEAKVYALRGDVFYNIGNYASANEDYKKTTSLNKGILQVWEQRMNSEIQLEDYEGLLKTSKSAIDYFPLQFNPYFFNAVAMIKTGKTDKLKMQMAEAQFMAANDNGAKMRMSYLDAMLAFKNGKLEDTKDFVGAYASTKNTDFLVHELIGDIYAKSGDIKSALQAWNYAHKLGNNTPTLLKKISEEKYIN